jgi:hypothetical protein
MPCQEDRPINFSHCELWREGGEFKERSLSEYLTLNAAAVAIGFAAVFGLLYLLPALARRYRRWLNT